ncbi:uncharacterized protein HMPREF1541_06978 [Cyphellophora europaea CBS 101466]|uniref:Uncharacterized protein n=1 Tax=Cyphellophora europaea (strain CBS 101466) TaxID=1220924 RepID=W2RR06_CYPE1|nr:uncharacterized protein HMPREF1541_06978 [Cyphellophora europaea CBS 101466]ETN38936.1 hypothetical protein HMPREF1541_06978 [Cyphellophora europaea CBS 101466]
MPPKRGRTQTRPELSSFPVLRAALAPIIRTPATMLQLLFNRKMNGYAEQQQSRFRFVLKATGQQLDVEFISRSVLQTELGLRADEWNQLGYPMDGGVFIVIDNSSSTATTTNTNFAPAILVRDLMVRGGWREFKLWRGQFSAVAEVDKLPQAAPALPAVLAVPAVPVVSAAPALPVVPPVVLTPAPATSQKRKRDDDDDDGDEDDDNDDDGDDDDDDEEGEQEEPPMKKQKEGEDEEAVIDPALLGGSAAVYAYTYGDDNDNDNSTNTNTNTNTNDETLVPKGWELPEGFEPAEGEYWAGPSAL